MNKKTLAEAILANSKEGDVPSAAAARRIVDTVLDAMGTELESHGSVRLEGFGTFSVADRAERSGKNPQTGKAITIPACKTVKFKPSNKLKEAVNH